MNRVLPGIADFLLAPSKKREVGKIVCINTHFWDLQPGGNSFRGKSVPDLLQAMMKIVMQAPGFQDIACSFLRVLLSFSVCLTQTFSAEVNAECGGLGNAVFSPMLW